MWIVSTGFRDILVPEYYIFGEKNILETNYYKGYFKPNYVFTTFLQKSDGEWVKTKNCLPYPDRGELNNIYIKSKLLFGMLCYEIAAQKNFSIHGQKKKHSHIHCGSISLIINTRPGTNWVEYYWNVTKFWNYIRRNGSTARLKRFWPRQMKRPEEISQIKMFNPNLWKKESYYMNIKIKIWVICLYNLYNKFKFHVIWLDFS